MMLHPCGVIQYRTFQVGYIQRQYFLQMSIHVQTSYMKRILLRPIQPLSLTSGLISYLLRHYQLLTQALSATYSGLISHLLRPNQPITQAPAATYSGLISYLLRPHQLFSLTSGLINYLLRPHQILTQALSVTYSGLISYLLRPYQLLTQALSATY